MRIGSYTQQPADRLKYVIDYSQWLRVGETLTGATFTVTPVTDVPLVVSDVVVGSLTVEMFVEGGESSTIYLVTVDITTSLGQKKQDEITYAVEDLV